MNTLEAIKSRRSARAFNLKPVERPKIEALIDAARFAATARNVQPWEFIAVTRRQALQEIANLAENGRFVASCACCIGLFCQDTKYYLEDGCSATQNILLSATELGLSSCWVAGDKKDYADKIRDMLKVPAGFKLVSLIALGYSDADVSAPAKRPLQEMLHWETW